MKHKCPTYLKSIGKSKALTTTLRDTKPEDDSDNEDDGILNAFTAIVNPTDGIVEDVVEEEELVESKFEKMDDQDDIHTAYEKLYKLSEKHEKLYRLTTKKLSDVELDSEELSTKFNEANQTIGALRFENNFLAEKTKKLEAKLFQVRAQLEKTSSAKLDEMLRGCLVCVFKQPFSVFKQHFTHFNTLFHPHVLPQIFLNNNFQFLNTHTKRALSLQKSASDRIGLGYGFSSSNIASTSTLVFVSPSNNVEIENNNFKTVLASENLDKGKSILGAPPKQDKKEVKNPRVKKGNSQKPKQKKQHLCHHYGVANHTRPNCYKWLATQQSNDMIESGS